MDKTKTRQSLALPFSSFLRGVRKLFPFLDYYDNKDKVERKDIDRQLRYNTNPGYEDYRDRYNGQDIAKAVIDRPAEACWSGGITFRSIIDENDTESTKDSKFESVQNFNDQWNILDKEVSIIENLVKLDKLSSIGHYGGMVLGIDDIKEVEGFAKRLYRKNKRSRKLNLIYLKPFGEGNLSIANLNNNPNNKRFGLPELYKLKNSMHDIQKLNTAIPQIQNNTQYQDIDIHWTRILHVNPGGLESQVYGIPVLSSIYRRLQDLDKIVGGSAEMFWKGARPGYQGIVDNDYHLTEDTKKQLEENIEIYSNDLQRFFVNEGIELKSLEQQVANPTEHFVVQIQLISAATGIPQRILIGSERGELASSEDRKNWFNYLQARRNEYLMPYILHPLIQRLMELRILPEIEGEWKVMWDDFEGIGEIQRVELGEKRSIILKNYGSSPINKEAIPIRTYMKELMGFEGDQLQDAIKDQEENGDMDKVDYVTTPTPRPANVPRPNTGVPK